MIPGRASPFGIPYQTDRLDTCQQLCSDNAACVGIDVVPNVANTEYCWLHFNKDDFDDERNVPFIIQYQIRRCSGSEYIHTLKICLIYISRNVSMKLYCTIYHIY